MGEKKTILVVEDSPPLQELMAKALGEEYLVLQAESIQDGYRLFQEYRDCIHVILMDGDVPPGTPEMPTTAHLVRRIRAEGFKGSIVAISGKEELQRKLREAGCEVELMKPFSLRRLYEVLGA